jgi:hypothetical protein
MTRRSAILWTALAVAAVASVESKGQLPAATGRQLAMQRPEWKLFLPASYEHRPGAVADVLVHFHGHPQTVWNNAAYARLNAVVVTVNYNGLSSAYSTPFAGGGSFRTLLDDALARLREQPDFPDDLRWGNVAVSSFSAGYGAVREVLKQQAFRDEIDALVLADSLYASTDTDGTPVDSQLADFINFARLAAEGKKTFVFTHSLVPTNGYERTEECGDEMLARLGLATAPIDAQGLGSLAFYRHAERGGFDFWGARGATGDAHMAHLRYLGEFLQDLPLAKIATKSLPAAR